jgi:protein-L-isoaspartate(D-aspartate) O-methyltransferase
MMHYEQARIQMVNEQLTARGIKDERVLNAMRKIPRHFFVQQQLWDRAYEDCALSIGEGQTISQPYMVALMTQALELKGGEKVLEVGTGSGYQTAILASLSEQVWSVERLEELAEQAREILTRLDFFNVRIRVGDGTLGWPEGAPFDAILVTAGSPDVPHSLMDQLKVSGCMVIPVGDRKTQVLHKLVKTQTGIQDAALTGCVFVPLIGRYGWHEEPRDNGGPLR